MDSKELLKSLTMNKILWHQCDCFPKDKLRKVEVDFDQNWAWSLDLPELNFPVYKSCCHFFVVNDDDSIGEEIDMEPLKPVIVV